MKRTLAVVLGGLALAGVAAGGAFVAAQADDSSSPTVRVAEVTASAESTASVESKTPALPENLERIVATTTAAFDFPMGIHDDGEETLYLSRDDFVRQRRAIIAQMAGLPFEPSELLAPLYDADGTLAAYRATNIKGRITLEEAQSPGFDLCARQAADTGRPARGCQ